MNIIINILTSWIRKDNDSCIARKQMKYYLDSTVGPIMVGI